jgi:type IV secretion system protein VirD4
MPSIRLGRQWQPKSGRAERPVSYDLDRHVTLFGPTGSGKGVALEIPNLLTLSGLSIISIDPKGQNAAVCARWRRTVSDVLVLNPFGLLIDQRPDLKSIGFNPLAALDPASPRFFEHAAAIAEALIKVDGDSQPHFPQSARGLIQALIMWEAVKARRERRTPTLANVRHMLTEAEVEQDDVPIAGLRFHAAQMVAKGGHQIASLAGRFIDRSREIDSVVATADTQTRWLLSGPMADDLGAARGIDWSLLKEKPVTVFVIIPAEYLDTHAGSVWLRLVVTCAMNALYRHGVSGGLRTLFLLSEFAQLGKLESVSAALAQGRGYGVQLFTVLQDGINQLRTTYGRDAANTFLGMSGAAFAFAPNDTETAEWMSKRAGEVSELGLSASDDPNGVDGARINYQERRRRIYPPDSLFDIPEFHGLVFFAGQSQPVPVYAAPYWELPELASRFDPDPYHPGPAKPAGAKRSIGRMLRLIVAGALGVMVAAIALAPTGHLDPPAHASPLHHHRHWTSR